MKSDFILRFLYNVFKLLTSDGGNVHRLILHTWTVSSISKSLTENPLATNVSFFCYVLRKAFAQEGQITADQERPA